MAHASFDGMVVLVWWGIGLESEERGGENRGPTTHFSRDWAANPIVWRFAPRYTLAYPMVGVWSRSTAEL